MIQTGGRPLNCKRSLLFRSGPRTCCMAAGDTLINRIQTDIIENGKL